MSGVSALRPCLIVPVHNRRETTRRCLAHLAEQGVPEWARVLVVDDGSTDGTGEMLVRDFPWAEMLRGDGRLWWAGAIRLGMVHAIRTGAGCLCWLNDDTLPDDGALQQLITVANTQGAVCGGVCRGTDGRSLAYSGGFMRNGWPAPLMTLPEDGEPLPVDWLHGNLVAIPQDVWRRLGLPEPGWMRHNLADIDYTHQARRLGVPVLLLPGVTAVAVVNEGMSYKSWADQDSSAWDLLSGLWNPKVWWYLPGLLAYLWRQSGIRGLGRLLGLLTKLIGVATLKIILPRRGWGVMKACRAKFGGTKESNSQTVQSE